MTRQQREELEQAFGTSSRGAASLFERHSEAELRRRPREGSWSAAECVVHLTLTSAATVPRVEAVVADLRARGVRREGRSRMDWLGRMLRWSLEPRRFRSRTAAPFVPQGVEPLSGVLPGFLEWQARILNVVREGEGYDLSAGKIVSPFDGRVRYNAFAALHILETHERRHLGQAEQAVSGGAKSDRG